jgi:ABC-type Fe3+/spermidine/putrescine transport system ATPase subunit
MEAGRPRRLAGSSAESPLIPNSGDLEISDLSKTYGDSRPALNRLTLSVPAGEFFCLIGPSGCGKTTALSLIAGYVEPDQGTIRLGDRLLNDLPPNKRGIGFVFQDYALFPHMTARENVVFGLKARRMPRDVVERRGNEMLRLTGLQELGHRHPGQLSGGQRQRVALARALAIDPALLLLDEPLSNLDAQLRVTMQGELLRLHRDVQRTTIMVTHDQDEAFAVADRVAVLRLGNVEQIGPPREVYRHPRNEFVARFMGAANVLRARVKRKAAPAQFDLADVAADPITLRGEAQHAAGELVGLVIRPEHVRVAGTPADDRGGLRCAISVVRYRSSRTHLEAQILSGAPGLDPILVDADQSQDYAVGDGILVTWHQDHVTEVPLG